MLKNITVTLAQSHGYLNIIWGLGFILSSLLPLTGDPILKNIGLGFGLVALLLVGFTLIFLKKEREDERSIGNTNRAYTMAFLLLMVLGTLYSYLDLRCHFNIAAIFGVATIGWILFLWIDYKDIQRKQKQEKLNVLEMKQG